MIPELGKRNYEIFASAGFSCRAFALCVIKDLFLIKMEEKFVFFLRVFSDECTMSKICNCIRKENR